MAAEVSIFFRVFYPINSGLKNAHMGLNIYIPRQQYLNKYTFSILRRNQKFLLAINNILI